MTVLNVLDLAPAREAPDYREWGTFPHYDALPKRADRNMRVREYLVKAGYGDEEERDTILGMCAEDVLFWVNAFAYLYEPRPTMPITGLVPFITWPFQDWLIAELNWCIDNQERRTISKTRDMGASWCLLALFTHRWLFNPGENFILGSRKEEYVDKPGDQKALFAKIDHILENLPAWMVPDFHRKKLTLHNRDNGAGISGESTNDNFARGDRATALAIDEFPAVDNGHEILGGVRDASGATFFVGTPKGMGTAHQMLIESGVKDMRVHWPLHPIKSIGFYTDPDGKPHSEWYDGEVATRSRVEVAQELDIDPLGSNYPFFDALEIRDHVSKHVIPAFHVGDLDYEAETGRPFKFLERPSGGLRLWLPVEDGKVVKLSRRYAIGVDISAGTGKSNSAFSVVDSTTGEKVAEYASPYVRPESLAEKAVALAQWFNGAYLIWESNGSGGGLFGKRVMELGYRDVYYRKAEMALSKKTSDTPGWGSSDDTKDALLYAYRRRLARGRFINRSQEALDETRFYVTAPNGHVVHERANNSVDPTGAKKNHGDRVIADALACKALGEVGIPDPETVDPTAGDETAPMGSLARRRAQWEEEQRRREEW